MDISNNPSPAATKQPLSTFLRAVCCAILSLCSTVLAVLPYYISLADEQTNAGMAVPTAITLGVLALCLVFVLIFCKKPVFMTCALIGTVLTSLLGLWMGAWFAALLCATLTGAALLATAKGAGYLLFAIPVPAAYAVALLITHDPLLCLSVLLPALGAIAMSICHRKKISIIISVGTVTGTLAVSVLLLLGVELIIGGMPPSIEGITEVIKAYHAMLSAQFSEVMQLMMENKETAAQITQILGGEISAEAMTEFSDSVATASLGLVPGTAIMVLWLFSFIAHRGFTALLVKDLTPEQYPAHLGQYAPSVPSAVLMMLSYLALLIFSMLPNGEIAAFITLNVLLVLTPMMSVSGILGIVANLKRAPIKWPLILTYVLAVLFLGIWILPMLAFFGAFAVIMQAIAKAIEQKMNSSQGGPMT